MTSQLPLLAVPPKLRPRQQQAHDYLAARSGGCDAEELGAYLHALKGRHADGVRCKFCRSEGSSVLRSKGLRPLVTYRNADGGRVYRLRATVAAPARPSVAVIATSDPNPATNPWADLGSDSLAGVPSSDLAEVTETA